MSFYHTPVLVKEVVASLACRPGRLYVDGTVGGGGHARAILEEAGPDGKLIGIDRDDRALEEAARHLKSFGDRVTLVKGNFAGIGEILEGLGKDGVDGILLDLGVSSHQLDEAGRGFSFSLDAPLDMRMDQGFGQTAYDVVNTRSEEELALIFREFGEERMSGRIARAIVAKRKTAPVETTAELASVVASAMPPHMKGYRIHPATRTFQAIRIAVNQELASLRKGIDDGLKALRPGGRFSVISYHSLEDRIVKETFLREAKPCVCPPKLPVCICGKQAQIKVIGRKPIRPTEEEMALNPRSRSAKLRTAERM